jgi:hypothetical protein
MTSPLYFTQDGFAEGQGLFHGFFGRQGGVSAGLYESLNVGVGSEDARDNVIENRLRIAQAAGVASENLLSLYQEHSARCLTITMPHDVFNAPKADAYVTDQAGIGLGVLTADCAPVLFYAGGVRPVIGAAHAGWKGALGGVLGATLEAMEALGADKSTIQAVIGPCIGRASYEVSEDFTTPFIAEDEGNERFFQAGAKAGYPLFDLAGYCASKLQKAGLSQIFMMDKDTYKEEAVFFSYRRTTHRGEADYGRQMSVIALR